MDIESQEVRNNILFKNRKIVVAVIAIFVIGLTFYIYLERSYREHVQQAEYYVNIGDYDKAYDEIKDLSPKSDDVMLFEKVKMITFSSTKLFAIKFIDEKETTSDFTNFEDGLINLVTGIKELDMKRATELGIDKEMLEIKNQYLDYLKNYYNLSETEALKLNISFNDYDYKDGKKVYNQTFLDQTKSAINYANSILERKQNAQLEQARRDANPLEITEKNGKVDGDYIYVTGAVKNNGSKSLSYIKVKVTYLDVNNQVIDTDWTYAVASEGLRPNEQKYFEVMTKHRAKMKRYSVEITEYQ
ncbi:FxLYD domain-containing protein [Brevibacillus parabrevis]|jgi:hypothetical protein|uniref:FxLYD domain-containing protein n=1 Tax=Brevibacillus parabrevis TaxID=54914 RepID=UPI002493029A|nr:FxLYD domain-containing protein [Brevibacillus parabrevis]